MIKPVRDGKEYNRGYQQALNDFGIMQLLSGIRSYSDEDFDADRARMTQPELESCAVFLILRVGANLNGSAIARYLNTLRKANSPVIADRAMATPRPRPTNSTSIRDRKHLKSQRRAIAIIGRSSEYYRMLSIIRSPVLSTVKMRTIGAGLCVGLFLMECLRLCGCRLFKHSRIVLNAPVVRNWVFYENLWL